MNNETTIYTTAEIKTECAIYAEGTRFTRDDLVCAWNTMRREDERLQDFLERFLEERGEGE